MKKLKFYTGGTATPKMIIDDAGQVGIGTTTPTTKFHVVSSGVGGVGNLGIFENATSTANAYSQIGIRAGSATSWIWTMNQNSTLYGGANSLNIYAGAGGAMTLWTNATEKVRIDTAGNVGIGTIAPGQPLQVNSGSEYALRLSNAAGTYYYDMGRDPATGALKIQGSQVGANNIVLAPTSGNVGIGTTAPSNKLEVAGGSIFAHGPTGGHGRVTMLLDGSDQFEWYPQATGLHLYDRGVNGGGGGNAGYKLSILNGGNVGIGTAAPIRNLQVNGELSLTRSDNTAYINVSNTTGNGGGTLVLRGLTTNGSAQTDANVLVVGNLTTSGNITANNYISNAIGGASVTDTPLAAVDSAGAWVWTRVVSSVCASCGSTYSSSVALSTTRPVLGIKISGGGGSVCVASVPNYFKGGIASNGGSSSFTTVQDFNLVSWSSWSAWSGGYGAFAPSTWIFETTAPGRTATPWTQGVPIYNKALGLTSIPPGRTLYYSQWTYGGGSNTCYVDVLYGDYQ
ncbi:MAG: hypothetical protein WC791_02750 [Candidatus Paceibacterota bacterium]